MLLTLIRSGDPLQIITGILTSIFIVFCSMPIHEYAHALVATKLGDETPRLQGRLTLNPIAHVDWLGAAMILLVGFGYAKPVQVNPRNFKNPKSGMILTATAGPFSNLIMANIFMLLRNSAEAAFFKYAESDVLHAAALFFYYAAYINVIQVVFNLLPIPPLDGSRIASFFIPKKYYFSIMKYERYIIIGVFVLLMIGVLDIPLRFLSGLLMNAIDYVSRLPFKAVG